MIMLFKNYENAQFEAVKALRKAVFVDEQGADEDAVFDECDKQDDTLFALTVRDGKNVATGRLVKIGDAYKIGRVAVLSSERGKGTGRELIEFLCKRAEEFGAKKIIVDAQLHAVTFYEKLGFRPTGEKEKYDIGILHLPMRKD